ncbi:tyrosine--tRNA ligase [Candidatus Woesearchaeota archaeon]|nr:tyrosine--tRNA ligase [Candidatus Woesearchaeota archaeon]
MTPEEKFQLIKRNTVEIVTEDELKKLLKEKKKPSVYLGWSITGRPHIGYFVPVLKLADFLKAGFKVKLLLSDITGALDNTPWDILDKRYKYYEKTIPLMFKAIGADIKNFEFVKASDINLTREYFFDLLKLSTFTSVHDAKKAASEVVKFGDNPKLSGLIYPLVQTLDEEYLKVDVQYGGVDQRKILMFARENHPKLGYKPRIEVMTPLIPGLIGKKMSASDPKSKIDLLDDEKTVQDKVKGAYCEEGVVEDNGVLAFVKHVIMVLKQDQGKEFVVERPEKWGGNLTYKTYPELEKDYQNKKLHPLDLKMALAREINQLLKPFHDKKTELNKIAQIAYP